MSWSKRRGGIYKKTINETLRTDEELTLQFSNGWLESFKRRNIFKNYKCHSEDGDADETAIENELPVLRARLSAFTVDDIFNADEFGFL